MRLTTTKSIILGLAVVIVIIGTVVFLNLQKSQPEENKVENPAPVQNETLVPTTTPETKTYRNEEWGFEFEYPENWIFRENVAGYSPFSKFDLIGAPSRKQYLIEVPAPPFTISIVTPEFADRTFLGLNPTISNVTIAEVSGLKYEYEFDRSSETAIILPLEQYKMILGTTKAYKETFNQILASFKFIEPTKRFDDQSVPAEQAIIIPPEDAIKTQISPDKKIVYWLSTKGELWKMKGQMSTALISSVQDMEDLIQETYGLGEPFPYVRGKVLDFWLSPDGNYIAYTTLEGHTSCCMSPPTIPIATLRIMKNDGTEKSKIEKPPGIRDPLLVVDGWLPVSDKLLFRFTSPDAGTSYSLFFQVSQTEQSPELYTEIYKFFKSGIEVDPKDLSAEDIGRIYLTVGDEPVYSPTGKKVAYLKYEDDPYKKDTVRLKDIYTKEIKTILENVPLEFGLALRILTWSKDGNLLLVRLTNKAFVFDKDGDVVFEGTFEEMANKFGSIFVPQ